MHQITRRVVKNYPGSLLPGYPRQPYTRAFNEFLYEFLQFFFNFGKFVKIREFFFAEVTNSRSMVCSGFVQLTMWHTSNSKCIVHYVHIFSMHQNYSQHKRRASGRLVEFHRNPSTATRQYNVAVVTSRTLTTVQRYQIAAASPGE